MKNPSYLKRSRHDVFYFVWPLPLHLRQRGSTTHVKVSLATRDPSEALQLSNVLVYHAGTIANHEGLRFMDHGDIINLLKDYFYELIDRKKAEIHKNGPLPESETWALIEQLEYANKAIKNGSDTIMPDENIDDRLQPIIAWGDVVMPPESSDYRILRENFKHAYKGYCAKILSHNQKQLDFLFTTQPDYLKAVKSPGGFSKPENRLARVIQAYKDEMTVGDAWGKRAANQVRDSFELLMEKFGKDFDVSGITFADARQMKELLTKLPANRKKFKETKDLPLMEQIKVDGMKRLQPASINKYLITYSGLFKWAKKNGYTAENPFAEMMLKESKEARRKHFDADQVRAILAEINKGKNGLANSEHAYWGTLIGLYTGARQNEIASLTPADVKQEGDVWYFDINKDGEQKQLKTQAAIRKVPIHPELLRRGLLEYVAEVRAMKNPDLRLLHRLTYTEGMGWARKLERWFNGPFLAGLGLTGQKVSYHSLRHTVITTMRQASIDKGIVKALVGHDDGDVTDGYTHGLTMQQLQSGIATLQY